MIDLKYENLPTNWAFCFNEECKVKDVCLRYISTMLIPEQMECCRSVLPRMAREESCSLYVSHQKVRKAWGFSKLFDCVKAKDMVLLRKQMYEIIGSERTFYRCQRGERFLHTEKQKAILELFRSYGYNEKLEFDNYVEEYDI